MHVDAIHAELKRFVHQRFKVDPDLLRADPSFEEMQADSLTRLEILLHADDTFGSHVLDHIEDGLISGTPPQRLSELAALVAVHGAGQAGPCCRAPQPIRERPWSALSALRRTWWWWTWGWSAP